MPESRAACGNPVRERTLLRRGTRALRTGVGYALWLIACLLPCSLQSQDADPTPRSEDPCAELAPFFSPPPEYQDRYGAYHPVLVFSNGQPVQTRDDWRRRRREILETWNSQIGRWPPLLERPALEILGEVKRGNIVQYDVRVEIARGQFEDGYLLQPPGSGPFPAVFVPYYDPETSVGLKGELRDFAYQLALRGYVTLSIGSPGGSARDPEMNGWDGQPLSFLAYVAANCHTVLAQRKEVDAKRIGVVGHSYGGKWAMFAACLDERFACGVWSDPGVAFDEARPNVNYWEPWYLGLDPDRTRSPGVPSEENPRTGAYRDLVREGHDLHEIQALMAPRPFLVSGGAEDPPSRWLALNHCLAVNQLLGRTNRVALTRRSGHAPTSESNEQIYQFFDCFLKQPVEQHSNSRF